jgi:hypothetical protein
MQAGVHSGSKEKKASANVKASLFYVVSVDVASQ